MPSLIAARIVGAGYAVSVFDLIQTTTLDTNVAGDSPLNFGGQN